MLGQSPWGSRLPPYPCAEMGLGFGVSTIDITPSDTAGEEGSVGVLDDLGEAAGPFDGLIAQDLLVAVDGAVHARPLGGVALNHAVAHHQIGADDDADIGGFEPLAGMDATDLVNDIAHHQSIGILSKAIGLFYRNEPNLSG